MTIYAIAIATNLEKAKHLQLCLDTFKTWGSCQVSSIYEIPCRDRVGADYWNAACLLESTMPFDDVISALKHLESDAGRKRPSHSISLDVDLIAWGDTFQNMQFNPKKLPLADDVVIPLAEIWQDERLKRITHDFKRFNLSQMNSN
uniref:2-amino-4-hydroxy-6- hydroxymethyldihydropteridine diphosphokinase n=1 Tax=uncultured Acinetobacter sp. TaxID=165433 RepID=UPI00262A0E1C|nr:2-amino-4-hydroxy-6-hydroxymethyldihydropteridine diphosphokinase [uncultured Acinetobacter sp.]